MIMLHGNTTTHTARQHLSIPYIDMEPIGICCHPIGWFYSLREWRSRLVHTAEKLPVSSINDVVKASEVKSVIEGNINNVTDTRSILRAS